MGTLIDIHSLYKSFDGQRAVDGLSLRVASGEIYGLVGPDGAGKTTTMRLLCGALRPDSAQTGAETLIRIAGHDVIRQTEQARAEIGYLPQRFSLYEELTVLENLRFFAEVRGLKPEKWRARCMDILSFVGLAPFASRRAGHLSGGMKQKLGLAVALVHSPQVLLLDEPTTGVDPVTRQDFWQLIIRLIAEEGIAVLISTPYMDEASRCTRLGFMRGGHLLVEGPPDELKTRLTGRIVELRGQPLPLLRSLAQEDKGVEDAQMFGDRLHLRIQAGKTQKVIQRLEKSIPLKGGHITHLGSVPPQLEDVFISLLESQP